MNFWLKFAVILCFELINLISSQDDPSASLECSVVTELGAISGTQMTTAFEKKPFCGYKGIRYAEPPVGDLRFKVCQIEKISKTCLKIGNLRLLKILCFFK